jgi:RimJ/RimL family protein N-acetyltransferase
MVVAVALAQVRLCVNAENVAAKRLYAAIGFSTFGVEPRAMRVGGEFYDEEHMVLELR